MPATMRSMSLCEIPDCGRPVVAKNLCGTHWNRVRRWGDARADQPITKRGRGATYEPRQCSVEECGDAVRTRGMCSSHYNQWRRTGSPLPKPVPTLLERFEAITDNAGSGGCVVRANPALGSARSTRELPRRACFPFPSLYGEPNMSEIQQWKRVADYGQPPDGALIKTDYIQTPYTPHLHHQRQPYTDDVLWFVPYLPPLDAVAAPPGPPIEEQFPIGSRWMSRTPISGMPWTVTAHRDAVAPLRFSDSDGIDCGWYGPFAWDPAPPEPTLAELYPIGSWWRGGNLAYEVLHHRDHPEYPICITGGSYQSAKTLAEMTRLPGPPKPNGWRYMSELPDEVVTVMMLFDNGTVGRFTGCGAAKNAVGWMPEEQFARDHGCGDV